jgi:hypothetical protein
MPWTRVQISLEFPLPVKKSCGSSKSSLIYAILTCVSVSRIVPKSTSKRSLSLWHLTLWSFTTREAKDAIFVITSRRSLSQVRTCGDGDRMTGIWSSIPCHKKLMGCKASRFVFCSVVAHNTTQVSMGCLSAGYAAALFSGKHSACPE